MISLGIMNVAMAGKKWLNMHIVVQLSIYVSALLLIWKNAPVENARNPLENEEIQIYSHKAKLIVVCYGLLEGISIVLHKGILYDSFFYGVAKTASVVLAGKWKYKKE